MTQRRAENTNVQFWTFSPVSVKLDCLENSRQSPSKICTQNRPCRQHRSSNMSWPIFLVEKSFLPYPALFSYRSQSWVILSTNAVTKMVVSCGNFLVIKFYSISKTNQKLIYSYRLFLIFCIKQYKLHFNFDLFSKHSFEVCTSRSLLLILQAKLMTTVKINTNLIYCDHERSVTVVKNNKAQ